MFDRRFETRGLAFISDKQAADLANAQIHPGDVLLNITGDGVTFGRACLVPDSVLPACVNQHVSIIRPDPSSLDPGYLLSYLTHPSIKSYVESFNAGGSRRAITKGHIESFDIPVPPLREQRAIAALLQSIDDKIELNRRMNDTLDAIACAIFKSWFVDFDTVRSNQHGTRCFPSGFASSEIGIIPNGWRVGTVSELTETVLGGDWGRDAQDSDATELALCIRGADIADLQSGGLGKLPKRFLKKSSLATRRLQPQDLIIEISGGSPTQSTGRPVLITPGLLSRFKLPVTCSNFCRLVRLRDLRYSWFLYLWLRYLYARDEFLQYENGTTGIKNLAFTKFSETHKLALPEVQVVTAFQNIADPLFAMMQANGAEIRTLEEGRDALLPKLVSGQIRIEQSESFVEVHA
ncbi:MAG TPA: restriction endonuclease subunit S [Candidatus Angelobacter sp.]